MTPYCIIDIYKIEKIRHLAKYVARNIDSCVLAFKNLNKYIIFCIPEYIERGSFFYVIYIVVCVNFQRQSEKSKLLFHNL